MISMMSHFIFVINDTEIELDRRLFAKQWPFYENTNNVRNLKGGDKIVIYEAGLNKHRFVSDAEIDSVTNTAKQKVINLRNVSKWKKFIDIKNIYENLEIIKKPEYYGVYLAGGIKRINPSDFELIVSNHR